MAPILLDPYVILRIISTLKDHLAWIEAVDLANKDNSHWGNDVNHYLADPHPIQSIHVEEGSSRAGLSQEKAFAALVWQLHLQTITLLTFMLLFERGLVDFSGVCDDVDFNNPKWQTWNVQNALENFEFMQKLHYPPSVAVSEAYLMPLTWLACMIVRTTQVDKLEHIIVYLETEGILGRFDHTNFRNRWRPDTILRKLPSAMEYEVVPAFTNRHSAFILPDGLSDTTMVENVIDDILEKCRYSVVLFRRFFQLDREGTCFPATQRQ